MSDLKVYKGDAPYIFVSYAHRDSDRVFPLLQALQDVGYRIWFDQGIEAGTEWSNNIALHLRNCSAFLFFASNNSVNSENCLDEVAYAKSHNKPALLAYLEEDVTLPAGADMQTARFQRMFIARSVSLSAFVENFSAAAIFDVCRSDAVSNPIPTAPAAPAAPAKKPLSKPLLVGILAVAVVAVLLLVLLLPKGDSIPQDTTPPTTGTPIATPEEIQLSDQLSDHTFRLSGVVYKLPVPYATLVQNGWALSYSDATPDSYLGGQQEISAIMVKDGKQITAYVYNPGEYALKVSDCLIGAIEVEQRYAGDFCIAAEMTPAASEEALSNAFGAPTERSDSSSSVLLKWTFSNLSGVKIRLYPDGDSKYSSILLQNYVLSTEKVENKVEAPAYLDDYTAPDALGTDLNTPIVSVDAALYELPVPLREFLNNGWSISSGAGSVLSGATAELTLKKDAQQLDVRVANLSLYKTAPANCIVTRIYADRSDNVEITIPGGIALGMPASQLEGRIPEGIDVYDGTYSVSYNLYDTAGDRDFRLNFTVDKETQVVESIQIIENISGFFP